MCHSPFVKSTVKTVLYVLWWKQNWTHKSVLLHWAKIQLQVKSKKKRYSNPTVIITASFLKFATNKDLQLPPFSSPLWFIIIKTQKNNLYATINRTWTKKSLLALQLQRLFETNGRCHLFYILHVWLHYIYEDRLKRQRTCGLHSLKGLAALLAHHWVDSDSVLCLWGEAPEDHSGLRSINKHLEESGGQRVWAGELDHVFDNVLKVYFHREELIHALAARSVWFCSLIKDRCKRWGNGCILYAHKSQKRNTFTFHPLVFIYRHISFRLWTESACASTPIS